MDKTDIMRKDKTGFTELEDKYWRALLLIQSHVNEPDVVKSIVDKAIGRPEDVIPLEDPLEAADEEDIRKIQEQAPEIFGKPDNEDSPDMVINHVYVTSTNKKFKVLQIQRRNGGNVIGYAIEWLDSKQRDFMAKDTFDNALRTGGIKKESEDSHFGEEQAEGLDNLLEGLKDTPHDNRW